eukprot:scaffold9005_cov39-Tisochrysis_lutea.AAC.1
MWVCPRSRQPREQATYLSHACAARCQCTGCVGRVFQGQQAQGTLRAAARHRQGLPLHVARRRARPGAACPGRPERDRTGLPRAARAALPALPCTLERA